MKRAVLSFMVVAALATSASATEDGCTAFVVGKKASATGCPFKDAPPAYFATGAARAPAFAAEKGQSLRLFADVSARTETPDATVGYLSAQDANRGLVPVDPITAKVFSQGGKSYMRTLVNSAPGMTYRKYAHFKPTSEPVTPVIVVEGAPSESEWRNWTAEDLAAAQSHWGEHWDRLSAQDRSGDRADIETFEKSLAADIDHTAQVVTRDGYSRFLLDGKETPPFAYKVSGRDGAQYSGKPLQRYGVKVGCIVLALGELPGRRALWSANGFDVKMAVDKIRDSMRFGDESCFILALGEERRGCKGPGGARLPVRHCAAGAEVPSRHQTTQPKNEVLTSDRDLTRICSPTDQNAVSSLYGFRGDMLASYLCCCPQPVCAPLPYL